MEPIMCDNNIEKYLRVKYLFVLSDGCLNVLCLRRSRFLCVAQRYLCFTSALPQLSSKRMGFLRRLPKLTPLRLPGFKTDFNSFFLIFEDHINVETFFPCLRVLQMPRFNEDISALTASQTLILKLMNYKMLNITF